MAHMTIPEIIEEIKTLIAQDRPMDAYEMVDTLAHRLDRARAEVVAEIKSLFENQEDMQLEFDKVVSDHFWELM